jgi:plasmid stabilization system protein ParE
LRVVITKRAQNQLDRIEAWWHRKRDKAPTLFEDELEEAKGFLSSTPNLARVHAARSKRLIRCTVMPKTKVKLYFWVDESAGVVNILSAWGGKRGREPKL